MQNIVVIGRVYSKLEHYEFSSNFEFDRNMLSGTGAKPLPKPEIRNFFIIQHHIMAINHINTYMLSYMQRYWSQSSVFQYFHLFYYFIKCCITVHLYIPSRKQIYTAWCCQGSSLTHPHYCRIYASRDWINIGSGNGLAPNRWQAITWTNAVVLSIRPLGTNFSEILIKKQNSLFMEMHLKMSSAKWRPFCPGERS